MKVLVTTEEPYKIRVLMLKGEKGDKGDPTYPPVIDEDDVDEIIATIE